ncbi:hypothetical protein Tco_1155488 [Tanacetum coccineum]
MIEEPMMKRMTMPDGSIVIKEIDTDGDRLRMTRGWNWRTLRHPPEKVYTRFREESQIFIKHFVETETLIFIVGGTPNTRYAWGRELGKNGDLDTLDPQLQLGSGWLVHARLYATGAIVYCGSAGKQTRPSRWSIPKIKALISKGFDLLAAEAPFTPVEGIPGTLVEFIFWCSTCGGVL